MDFFVSGGIPLLIFAIAWWFFSGAQPFAEIGPVKLDAVDIIAIGMIGIGIWLVATGQITGKELLGILAAVLIADGGRKLIKGRGSAALSPPTT